MIISDSLRRKLYEASSKPKLDKIIIFEHLPNMVACFDPNGQQIGFLQGPFDEVKALIQEYAKDYWLDVEITR
jgi:hypothetical protein